jgi:GMP synthase (glutamine-hydrolysing)
MKPLLFVHCDPVDTFGVAPEAVASTGVSVVVWDAIDPGSARHALDDISGVVLFGSSQNVGDADGYPFIKETRELTRETVDLGIPFLGVCFGAQVLAWALDAEVGTAPVREVGFEPVHVDAAAAADLLVSHWEDGDRVFQWHMDTFALPDGAVRLASGDRVENQAFRVADRAWGLQWHFEIDRPEIELWLEDFGEAEDLLTAWGKSAAQIRNEADTHLPLHQEKGAEVFRRFAHIARERSA